MKRLSISGASLALPALTRADLRGALERLQVSHAFDEPALDNLYLQLGKIIGSWLANEQSKDGAPVSSALRKVAKDLAGAAQLLSGRETGIRSTTQIFATRMASQILALDPALKTNANDYLLTFLEHANRVGHACQVAAADLAQKSNLKGKEKLHWYDDFTKLLVGIAERAGVRPTLGNDSVHDTPCGWLFDAAQELEGFLFSWMLSPSGKACGRRLERSLKRIDQRQPQRPAQAK
jgi:hypothetical protein